MRTLRREFQDGRVCRLCGSPAALLLRTFVERHGDEEWHGATLEPVWVTTNEHDPLAVEETRFTTRTTVQSGVAVQKREPHKVWGRRVTHVCTRDHVLRTPPNPHDPLTYPSCGVLTFEQTKEAQQMPERCYVERMTEEEREEARRAVEQFRLGGL